MKSTKYNVNHNVKCIDNRTDNELHSPKSKTTTPSLRLCVSLVCHDILP